MIQQDGKVIQLHVRSSIDKPFVSQQGGVPRRSRQCQATSQGFTAGLRLSSYAGVPFLASPVPVFDASHTLGLELPITSSDKDAAFHPAISNRKYQPLSCLGLARPDFCKLDVSRRALFRVKVGPVVSSPAAPRNDLLSATKIACLVTSSPQHQIQTPSLSLRYWPQTSHCYVVLLIHRHVRLAGPPNRGIPERRCLRETFRLTLPLRVDRASSPSSIC